jgi:hypothetical protein
MISLFRVYLPRAQPLKEMNYHGFAHRSSRAGSAFFGWQGLSGKNRRNGWNASLGVNIQSDRAFPQSLSANITFECIAFAA